MKIRREVKCMDYPHHHRLGHGYSAAVRLHAH